jgi:hypothetical protein
MSEEIKEEAVVEEAVANQGMDLTDLKCPSCGSIPHKHHVGEITLGNEVIKTIISFKCGSMLTITDNGNRVIRTDLCVDSRISLLEKEVFQLKTRFWSGADDEPKLVNMLLAEIYKSLE